MKAFLKIYRWSMEMKLRMALYTFVAIFIKIVFNLLQGENTIEITELLSMWGISLLFAIAETVIFPGERDCTKWRSFLWLILANICFAGGAILFKWFAGIPVWGGVLLLLLLELGLGMMWFGDRFVLKMDSAQLTQMLKDYQQRNNSWD